MDPVDYHSDIDDNRRWRDFAFAEDDIVVSTRSKHGTTWVQTICLLLVHGTSLPEALGTLSPWVDWLGEDLDALNARMAARGHRRVLKTHTPLDGLPDDPRAVYVVVARHPIDAALSLYHQSDNIDRARVAERLGQPPPKPRAERLPPTEWLREWIHDESAPAEWLESPRGVLHHVTDAWERARAGGQRVLLVHYADLLADREGQMRRLAAELGLTQPEDAWPELVEAAGFAAMSAAPDTYAPDPGRTLVDRAAFFRRGRCGEGRSLLRQEEVSAFEERCRRVAPGEVCDWLLR